MGGGIGGGQKCATRGGAESECGGAGISGGVKIGGGAESNTSSGGSIAGGSLVFGGSGRGVNTSRLPHRARIRLVPSLRISSPFGTWMVCLVQCTEFAERYEAYTFTAVFSRVRYPRRQNVAIVLRYHWVLRHRSLEFDLVQNATWHHRVRIHSTRRDSQGLVHSARFLPMACARQSAATPPRSSRSGPIRMPIYPEATAGPPQRLSSARVCATGVSSSDGAGARAIPCHVIYRQNRILGHSLPPQSSRVSACGREVGHLTLGVSNNYIASGPAWNMGKTQFESQPRPCVLSHKAL